MHENKMNSIKVWYKNGYYFTNSKNTTISDSGRLLLNLTDKVDLRKKDKYIDYSILSIYYRWKNTKKVL